MIFGKRVIFQDKWFNVLAGKKIHSVNFKGSCVYIYICIFHVSQRDLPGIKIGEAEEQFQCLLYTPPRLNSSPLKAMVGKGSFPFGGRGIFCFSGASR